MQYIKKHTAQRRAARNLTTQSHPNYGMAKHTRHAAYSHYTQRILSTISILAKETHFNRKMAISMFKYTYRCKSPGTSSKVKLHATSERDWNIAIL